MSHYKDQAVILAKYQNMQKIISQKLCERSQLNNWVSSNIDVAGIQGTVKPAGRLGLLIGNRARKLTIERHAEIKKVKSYIDTCDVELKESEAHAAELKQVLVKAVATGSVLNDHLIAVAFNSGYTSTEYALSETDIKDWYLYQKDIPATPVGEQFLSFFTTWPSTKNRLKSFLFESHRRRNRAKINHKQFESVHSIVRLLAGNCSVFQEALEKYRNTLTKDNRTYFNTLLDRGEVLDISVHSLLGNFLEFAGSEVVSPIAKCKKDLQILLAFIELNHSQLSYLQEQSDNAKDDLTWTKKLFDVEQYMQPPTLEFDSGLLALAQELGVEDLAEWFCIICFKHIKKLSGDQAPAIKLYFNNEVHGSITRSPFSFIEDNYCVND